MKKTILFFVGLLLTAISFGATEVVNIAAFKATSNVTSSTEYKITGNVTFVWRSGRNIYIKDDTGGLLVYDSNSAITKSYQNGDVVSGGIVGTLTMYNGLCEMIPTQDWAAGASGTPAGPTTVTMSQLLANFANYESQLIKLEGVQFTSDASFGTYSAANLNITQSGSAMVCRNNYGNITGYAVNSTDSYNIVGFAVPYNTDKQIAPRNADDIEHAASSVAETGVSLNKTSVTLSVNETERLTATVIPSNASNKNITWSSSNNSIATISSSGVINAVAAGTTTITVTTQDGNKVASCTVVVKASNLTNLKITTWNVSWLGCPEYSPEDDQLQMKNVATVIERLDADIVALQEVTMKPVSSLDTVLKHLGSAWAGAVWTHNNSSCQQDMAIIYKKASATLTNTKTFIGSGWARSPALYSMKVTKGGKNIQLEVVNIHAKATTSSSVAQSDYNQRLSNSRNLKNLLDGNNYKSKNIIIIGDYNDYLDGRQCNRNGCPTQTDSPYKNFMDDVNNYKGLTRNFSNTIDHITISNELFPVYVSDSARRETAVANSIPSYRYTTSDHTPVSITLNLDNTTTAIKNTYSEQLLLYPNPVQHTLNVESMAGNIAAVKVFSLNGTLIFEQKNIHASQLSISTAAWQSGAYIVTVHSEKGEVGSRLVVRN